MALFDSIKNFISKFIRSPIRTGVVAFLLWRILKDEVKEETLFCEDIKVIARKGGKELIFDTKRKIFAVFDGRKIKYYSSEPLARRNFEGVSRGRGFNEKLDKLYTIMHS